MNKFTFALIFLLSLPGHIWSKTIAMVHMGRKFTLVIPDRLPKGPRPLVILLHGCKQNPSLILEGTQFEKAAEKNGFAVLVPEQPNYLNMDHCWNWFLDINQQRLMTNEMGQIISAIDIVAKSFKLDPERVFVTGISAGGVMAHNLSSCYPDVFAGSAIHSGLNFKVAENIKEAQNVLTSYEQKSPSYLGKKIFECSRKAKKHRLSKVLIIHGNEDSRVPTLHSHLISKSQAVWRDYLDDGRNNDSIRGKISVRSFSFQNSYEVEKTDISYPGFHERKLIVKNLGHAWGGGKPVTVNFDPKAPSSNDFIIEYFGLNN